MAETLFDQSAQAALGAASERMHDVFAADRLALPKRLALACRYLADHGHAATLAGQITVRADDKDSFWTTNFGQGFSEARASNVVRCDGDMNVIDGEGMANPAIRFHLWIYRARPELVSIVHTHPPFCSALSMTSAPLVVAHMDTTMFYEDCARLEEWPGLPFTNDEGRVISQALGGARAIILNNHGLITVGQSLEEALYLAAHLEQAARLQILASGLGAPIKPISPERAREAHDFLLSAEMVDQTVDYWFRQTLRRHPDID